MKLKTIEKDGVTYAEVKDGKPLYLDDAGAEVAFDVPATTATINRITGESQRYKERAQAAEQKLTGFEGIDDPAKAREALNTVKNLDDKKLIDAGQVETIKAEAIKAVEEKYKPVVEERDKLKTDLYGEKIGGAFSRSPLIVGDKAKFAIPADLVQARFGQHFKIEEGKTVATDSAGNKIYSKARPGEYADFDEALEIIVDAYPHKDSILKGTGNSGSGSQPNGANPNGGDMSKLSPVERMNAARAAAG